MICSTIIFCILLLHSISKNASTEDVNLLNKALSESIIIDAAKIVVKNATIMLQVLTLFHFIISKFLLLLIHSCARYT